MDHDDLRQNCDVMLRYFLEIPPFILIDIDDQENALPKEFALHQNYPNPFNPNTIIRFDLPVQSQVSLTIYNILGQQVKTALDRTLEAGYHEVIWDGKSNSGDNVSTSMYFYKLKAGDFVSVKKMLLLK